MQVALNKIDRLYGWESTKDRYVPFCAEASIGRNIPDNCLAALTVISGFMKSFKNQKAHVQQEFRDRANQTVVQFAEQVGRLVPALSKQPLVLSPVRLCVGASVHIFHRPYSMRRV